MKKTISRLKKIKIKVIILSIASFINNLKIYKVIILSFKKLDIQSKLESWGISQYLYVLFFIPISILTLMSFILMIEGQYFHLFIGTRCEINSISIQSQYCESYFGLLIGIMIAAIFQMYIYWHYITSLKSRLFPKDN